MSFLSNLNPFSKDSGYGLMPGGDAAFKGRSILRDKWGLSGNTGDPSNYASETYAALTRDQWQTYMSVFVPIENQLIDYATDKNKPMEAMAEASADVNSAFDSQQGATQRRLAGLGVSLNGDEQAAQSRSAGLSRSLADVGAQNMAGELTRQRQQSLLGNPAPQALTAGG